MCTHLFYLTVYDSAECQVFILPLFLIYFVIVVLILIKDHLGYYSANVSFVAKTVFVSVKSYLSSSGLSLQLSLLVINLHLRTFSLIVCTNPFLLIPYSPMIGFEFLSIIRPPTVLTVIDDF